jgi:hypothetical protein
VFGASAFGLIPERSGVSERIAKIFSGALGVGRVVSECATQRARQAECCSGIELGAEWPNAL